MTSPNRIVIIHDTDQDGCCAAWLVRAMTDDNYSSAMTEEEIYNDNYLFIPMRAGDNYDITDQLRSTDIVFVVDRSLPVELLHKFANTVSRITIIDHHKTAMDMYADAYRDIAEQYTLASNYLAVDYQNIIIYIDMEHSGCGLISPYFETEDISGFQGYTYCNNYMYRMYNYDNHALPWFVAYVEDRDLWRFKLEGSKILNNYINSAKPSVMWFQLLAAESATCSGNVPTHVTHMGIAITEYKDGITKHIAESSSIEYIRVDNFTTNTDLGPVITIAVLQCPYMFISDVCDYLLSNDPQTSNPKPDVVIVYNPMFEPEYAINSSEVYNGDYGFTADTGGSFVGSEQQGYVYSLRSKHGVSDYAKSNGGGGHPNACGFKSPLPPAILLQPLFR